MSLDIKNERVHQVAREAASLTGRSQTSIIELALERLIAQVRAESDETARQARIDALWHDIDSRPLPDGAREATRRDMEDMYDELGLPR